MESSKPISRKTLLRGMSRIKPEMMQKALKSVVMGSENKSDLNTFEDSSRLLELFPNGETSLESKKTEKRCHEITIFYNGVVTVYDTCHTKAKDIIRFAESEMKGNGGVENGLEMVRKLSLQRFLEKRKERLSAAAPYSRRDSWSSSSSSSTSGVCCELVDLSLSLASHTSSVLMR